MAKFIIKYGVGDITHHDKIEAENYNDAEFMAYEMAQNIAEIEIHWSAEEIDPNAKTDEE